MPLLIYLKNTDNFFVNSVNACPDMSESKDVDRLNTSKTYQRATLMVIGAHHVNEI